MSDTPIRRTNWTTPSTGQGDDPLAELERIVGRNPPASAPIPTRASPPPPQNNNNLPTDDFLGFSEDEFAAAFRSLEQQTPTPTQTPPVRQGSVFKKEPAFEPAPQTGSGYTRNFAQTFQDEISAPATRQEKFEPQKFEPEEFDAQEFDTRADAFDFDTRAIEATQPAYRNTYEPDAAEEVEPTYYLEQRPRSGFVTVIAVTGLVFVAVIGALIYSWVGTKSTGEPITIAADKTPVKKMAAADTEQPTQNKLIYDRLGTTEDDADNEKIVSREEQPVDNLNAQGQNNAAAASAQNTQENTPAPGPRVILPNPSAQGSTTTLNAPREVATTTIRVKPDGTMESLPGNTTTQPTAVTPKVITAPPAVKTTVPPTSATVLAPAVDETATAEPDGAAPEPVVRAPPTAKTAATKTAAAKTQRVANLAPATSTTPSSGAGFVVQVSSQKNEDSARASFTNMQARFPQVLSGYKPSIKAVTLGDKGTFYRVRVGPLASRDEATALCGRLKASGGDCVVTPN